MELENVMFITTLVKFGAWFWLEHNERWAACGRYGTLLLDMPGTVRQYLS